LSGLVNGTTDPIYGDAVARCGGFAPKPLKEKSMNFLFGIQITGILVGLVSYACTILRIQLTRGR
jgi:hypothetical protein